MIINTRKDTQLGIRNFNIKKIINYISQNNVITRLKLSQLTGLSKGSVTTIVETLINNGVVEEIGEGESSQKGGRKPVFIQLVNESYYSIGVDIRRGKISTVLMGLNEEILDSKIRFLSPKQKREEIIEVLIQVINETLKPVSSESQVIGLGVGIIGPLDWKEGAILNVPDFGNFKNMSIKDLIKSNFNFPIYIESGTNVAAYGEFYWDKRKKPENDGSLVYLDLNYGLGYGMINNGQIIHGKSSAGEIGHMVVDHNGPECFCGRNGCLFLYSSGYAILKNLGYLNSESEIKNDQFGMLLEEVAERYYQNDKNVRKVINEAVHYYMIILEDLGNLLSPHTITIGSSLKNLSRMFLDCIMDNYKMKKYSQYYEKDLINRIKLPHYEEKAIAAGAAVFVQNNFFNDPASYIIGKKNPNKK